MSEKIITLNGLERFKADLDNTYGEDIETLKSLTLVLNKSQNRFNPSTITENAILNYLGETTTNSSYNTSDFIETNGAEKVFYASLVGTTYYSGEYAYICQYSSASADGFISRTAGGTNPLTLDANCKYIRISVSRTMTFNEVAFDVETLPQDELSDYFADYYSQKIPNSIENSLDLELIQPGNLVNKSASDVGYTLNYLGVKTQNASYTTTAFSKVIPGSTINCFTVNEYGDIQQYAVYLAEYSDNNEGAFIKRTSNPKQVTLDSNCKYIKLVVSVNENNYGVFGNDNLEYLTLSSFDNFIEPYDGSKTISSIENKLNYLLNPNKEIVFDTNGLVLPVPSGNLLSIYFDNLLYGCFKNYIGLFCQPQTVAQRENCIQLTPAQNNNETTYHLSAFKDTYGDDRAKNGTKCDVIVRNVKSDYHSGNSVKVLLLGDSYTGMGEYQNQANSLLSTNNINVTWLGTLGDAPQYNEGRGGWRAYTYCHYAETTNADNEGIASTNPFYNPTTHTFDFSYYMSQNGYSGVDIVFINLGINDTGKTDGTSSNAQIIQDWNTIINSIKEYDENIKIVIWLPTLPCILDGVGSSYMRYINRIRMHKIILENWKGTNWGNDNIYIIPSFLVTDPKNDYPTELVNRDQFDTEQIKVCTDQIHLNQNGMKKLGNIIAATIQYLAS